MGEKVKAVKLALGAVRILSRHHACCKLHVNGIQDVSTMAEMAGSMYHMNAEKKAGQMGKALWARDGLCCVLKTEMDKC